MKTEGGKNKDDPFRVRIRWGESAIAFLLFLSASFAIIISAAIIFTLLDGSISFFSFQEAGIKDFLFGTKWVPSGGTPSFGVLPLLAGTTLVAGGALIIGAPLGIGAALYLSEFASKRVRAVAKPITEILAGIPSIVYGFFALLIISPILQEYFGASYFNAASAIIVMAIMILPIIVSVSDDAMRAVPNEMRQASLAMGATRWETATRTVLPAASSGVTASVLLGLARAIGETMVVTLAAGSVARLTLNPFGEIQTMTSYIAQVATGDIPPGVAAEAAFAVGLLLFIITYVVNLIAGMVVDRLKSTKARKKTGLVAALGRRIGPAYVKIKGILLFAGKNKKKITLKQRHMRAKIGVSMLALCLIFAVVFLAYLLASVFMDGLAYINVDFLTGIPGRNPDMAGIMPAILGSLYLMGLTMLLAIPIGVGAAVYLTEFAKDTRHTRFLRRLILNLAGVPSIVFGLVGYAFFVRYLGLGTSLLSGSLTLAFMILPMIVVVTEEALKSVPQSFRTAAQGVGATKWQTVRDHVLPNATPGILTGAVLSLSRAIGETAPILFIGAVFAKAAPSGLLDGFLALPLTVFYWTRHANSDFHALASATIIVLLIMLLSMNAIAIYIRQRAQARRDW